ncbi:MAG: signal peptidase I [Rubrobacteraceae bacterium]|uniref:signal peptidase I n=1 Tax=Rubrobacter naiadicus TaxID=1392641 RepID=UPI002360859F|nr:signal peptidase I [Rubrobacter naiadicus]MBX6762157.1 signal peptidase I [Rubrobacteraceae bacterium]MCL6438062.1 signal peptidase I [Rubrobacteraceae bacterium]
MSDNLSHQGKRPERRGRFGGPVGEFVITLVVAFVLVFGVVRPFIVEAYRIPSASMEPTLMVGDRVLANKFIYRFEPPKRGQIVIFKDPNGSGEDLIKRVVGVAGDTIQIKHGVLYVDGVAQKEPYIHKNPCVPGRPRTCSFGPVKVPPGHFFAMGDNRANSFDSRFFGAVPDSDLQGEAFLIFWPPGQLRWL